MLKEDMNEWNNCTLSLSTLHWGLTPQYVNKNCAFYFTLNVTQCCLWNDTNTAIYVTLALPSVLTVWYIKILCLPQFKQTPYFT